MSRAKIGVVVAVVVAALTLTAYVLTTSSLEKRIRGDVRVRVKAAQEALKHNQALEAQGLIKRAEKYAGDPRLEQALAPETPDGERFNLAQSAYDQFNKELKQDEPKPDFLALVNEAGKLAVMQDAKFTEDEDWGARYKAVGAALKQGLSSKDIWEWSKGVYKVGVAPVYSADRGAVKGALVVAYALNSKDAQLQSELVGMDVAYFSGQNVRATSFRTGGKEDTAALKKPLFEKGLAAAALAGKADIVSIKVGDQEYLATAAPLALNYDDRTSGAMVLMSVTRALEPTGSVKLTILLLGAGALVIAILAMLVTARLILGPAEEIELGVTDIINGNIDYTFKPAGADFDGLANALNVMLARLLGRPEPGEEEMDENGNYATPATTVLLDEEGAGAAAMGSGTPSPETLALAHEPEADYYRRIFGDYLEARKGAGEDVSGVHFEGFVAKLRLNEANLRKKYNCKAVRFRVQTKGGQVTLKPVPIV